MDRTRRLNLPYLMPSQAQKHVTLNEAMTQLDALVQLTVTSRSLPLATEPEPGSCQIVSDGEDFAGQIAQFADGAWLYLAPGTGWRAWIIDEGQLVVFDGGAWIPVGFSRTVDRLGVSATADETNRLAVSSPASLFTHDGGDHRMVINRAGATDTASVLLQSDWSGRAEIGLTGNDRLGIKVSPDGTDWSTALVADPATGVVDCPSGLRGALIQPDMLINGSFSINQRRADTQTLNAGEYGHDRWRAAEDNTSCTAIVGGIQMNSGALEQVCDVQLAAGQSVTFSAEISGADLTVSCLGQSATLSPESGRVAVTFGPAPDDVDTVVLRLSGDGAIVRNLKLETGPHATAFAARSRAAEMALCQFYYEQFGPGPGGYNAIGAFTVIGTNALSGFIAYAPKRVRPTVTFSGAFQCLGQPIANSNITSISSFSEADHGFEARLVVDRTLTPGAGALLRTENDPAAFIAIDAEH